MNTTAIKTILIAFASAGLFAHAQTPPTPGLTDSQIIEIVKEANEAEVELAELGQDRGENKEVKEFSKKMEKNHEKGEKDTKKVAKAMNVKAEKSADSRAYEDGTKTKISDLKKLKGKEFDHAFMQEEVNLHQRILDDLNQKLIPTAQSPDLKAHLQATKTHVEEHLNDAKKIQSTLTR